MLDGGNRLMLGGNEVGDAAFACCLISGKSFSHVTMAQPVPLTLKEVAS